MAQPLVVSIEVKVHGLWRVVLLGWAIKLFRLKQLVIVETLESESWR